MFDIGGIIAIAITLMIGAFLLAELSKGLF